MWHLPLHERRSPFATTHSGCSRRASAAPALRSRVRGHSRRQRSLVTVPARGIRREGLDFVHVGRDRADGLVTVVVEMTGDPVAVVEAEQGRELSDGERGDVKSRLKDAQEPVSAAIEDKGGSVQAEMQSAYNGLQAKVPAAELDAIASMPNVVAVHPVRTYSVDNAVSVPFLGVPQVWESTGYTGQNVKVAIIDTGIDYTHATFGGPGTVEAFQAAAATSAQPADPALYGPDAPRVKGGIDLVGDDYNADPTSASYQPVPHPDDNPLDCNGHGSHVAGTTGGSGVLADGTTYPGPYDTTTPSNTFRVGPGVAPQVDLYAVRVFGCEGSTDVVVPALDCAVDNGMDVVNMSLGSSFGRGDDPDAVAAANAVGAGVVVVASSGNAGHNPYLTGSPGTGDGVRVEFQLSKHYGAGATAYLRTIAKPQAGSVLVAVDGVQQPSDAFSCDAATGLVSFAAGHVPPPGAAITAGFVFDVPVRFDTDAIEVDLSAFEAGEIPRIPVVEILP